MTHLVQLSKIIKDASYTKDKRARQWWMDTDIYGGASAVTSQRLLHFIVTELSNHLQPMEQLEVAYFAQLTQEGKN